jgi:hypothetical protein
MASIKFDDGKEVILSAETTERLREELLKPKFLDVHNLRVSERAAQDYYQVAIGINSYGLSPEPTVSNMDAKYTFAIFNKEDAQKIVDNIQTIIDSFN